MKRSDRRDWNTSGVRLSVEFGFTVFSRRWKTESREETFGSESGRRLIQVVPVIGILTSTNVAVLLDGTLK